MQNRQNGRRRRGSGGNNPRPMGQPMGGQTANRLEVRVRGNAHQLLDKYKVLARDAHQAGDRVATEYYLQHADHYFRVLNDTRIRQDEMRARRGVFDQFEDDNQGMDGDESQGNEGDDGDLQDGPQERSRSPRQDRDSRQDRDARQEREPKQERRPRYEPRDRTEQRDRPQADYQDDGETAQERPRRWQQDRPVERATDHDGHDEPARSTTAERPRRAPRVRTESAESRTSDGEAALVAFGGVPLRESAPAKPDPLKLSPAPDAEESEAPKPRRRGRPKKAEAEPVES